MNLFIKLALCCILCAVLSLTIKKHSPEISFLMGIAALIGSAAVFLELFESIKTQVSIRLNDAAFSPEYFIPLLKCCAVSIISQICCGLCKDAGQAALAAGLEITGNLVTVLCLLPLIESLFSLLGGLL